MISIAAEDMHDEGKRGEGRLMQLVEAMFVGRETWPRCRSCGQHIAPADLEQRIERIGR
jgi:hypothetical protein